MDFSLVFERRLEKRIDAQSEFEVGELISRKEWTNLSQRLIWHGRRVCHSRKPACGVCPIAKYCPSYGVGEMDMVKARAMVKSEEDFK